MITDVFTDDLRCFHWWSQTFSFTITDAFTDDSTDDYIGKLTKGQIFDWAIHKDYAMTDSLTDDLPDYHMDFLPMSQQMMEKKTSTLWQNQFYDKWSSFT